MASYIIFLREGAIVDPRAIEAYKQHNRASGPTAGIRPLVVYGAMEALEGEAPDGMVMLEFADKEAAKAWYFSPSYQEAVKLRQKAAPYRAFIVEGL